MIKLTVTSGVNRDDISGGFYNNREIDAGLPTEIPVSSPRFLAVLEYIQALFPALTEAVLIPEVGSMRVQNPASIVFKTVEGPISDLLDATMAFLVPDVAKLNVYEYLFGKVADAQAAASLPSFSSWYAATHPPIPAPTAGLTLVGARMEDMTEIFGAPTFALAVADPKNLYRKGDVISEGGSSYTLQTLGHPMGVRKFWVLKG